MYDAVYDHPKLGASPQASSQFPHTLWIRFRMGEAVMYQRFYFLDSNTGPCSRPGAEALQKLAPAFDRAPLALFEGSLDNGLHWAPLATMELPQ